MAQILFIGDSTNRGIAHYVTERLNGSLTEWDRTHDTRLYDNINAGQTVISFAYYPQFWMPPGQRPVFETSLHQLLKTYDLRYTRPFLGAALGVAPRPSVCPYIPCIRFSRNKKAVETPNLVKT